MHSLSLSDSWKQILLDTQEEAAGAATPKATQTALLSTEELKQTDSAATRSGFSQGALVVERKVGAQAGVYKIVDLKEHVVLSEVDCFKEGDALRTVQMPYGTLFKNWGLFTGTLPERITLDWENMTPWNQDGPDAEIAKAHLLDALLSHAESHP